jgi:predicted O-methyltransferase YrrM
LKTPNAKDIVEARVADGYKLYIRFEDGVDGEVDLSQLIEFEGVFSPLQDLRELARLRVDPETGTVCWPNGADLDPDMLYAVISGVPIDVKGPAAWHRNEDPRRTHSLERAGFASRSARKTVDSEVEAMGEMAAGLIRRLHPTDPYAGFPYQDYPLDLQGGPEDALLPRLVEDLRPRLVIEVGTWKGATAVRLAALLRRQGADAALVCVDTWLGSVDQWEDEPAHGWNIRPHLRHGYPALYYQFLANVLHTGCADLVVPVPNTSANAARWLARQGVAADLVYVDGSHEEDDVYRDLCDYWKLLRPGGVMVGDDWHARRFGVICAVNRFARERDLPVRVAGQQWVLQKPGDGRAEPGIAPDPRRHLGPSKA